MKIKQLKPHTTLTLGTSANAAEHLLQVLGSLVPTSAYAWRGQLAGNVDPRVICENVAADINIRFTALSLLPPGHHIAYIAGEWKVAPYRRRESESENKGLSRPPSVDAPQPDPTTATCQKILDHVEQMQKILAAEPWYPRPAPMGTREPTPTTYPWSVEYKDWWICTDGINGFEVKARPEYEAIKAGPFTSLERAQEWIDNWLSEGERPEPDNHAGCKRQFRQLSKAWYGDANMQRDIADCITIGFYRPDGSTTGEFLIRWERLGSGITPKLSVFNDAWDALYNFSDMIEVMATLDGKDISPDYFAEELAKLGIEDATETCMPGEGS